MDRPVYRKGGVVLLAGTTVPVATIADEAALRGLGPTADTHGLPYEAVEFAVAYVQKREQRRAQRRNDPRRPFRLQGKRNSASGRRAEEWVTAHLGPAWRRLGGAGRVDVRYQGVCAEPVVRSLEVKRKKGADRMLRQQLVQNGVDALVRTYGSQPGIRQIEPTVCLRWSVFLQLLRASGQEVIP